MKTGWSAPVHAQARTCIGQALGDAVKYEGQRVLGCIDDDDGPEVLLQETASTY